MSDEIELHDSDLRILYRDEGVLLRLCPAYVHHWTCVSGVWIGEGRSQDVEIEVGLELQDGSFLEIHGSTISVRLVGDAKFVEHLPPDFAPTSDAG
jgi:hypothetical protein